MDLRYRLISSLSLLLSCLMAMALVIQFYSLRADIDTEIAASTRLVNVLLAAGSSGEQGSKSLATRLADAGLRHLSIRTADQAPAATELHPLLEWMGVVHPGQAEQEIHINDQTLFIAPNPGSEIEERLGDTVRLFITLLLYSGATLLVVWWSADRALSPVRSLEKGLNRLAKGERDPGLPAFALREFSRVAGAIEHLASALSEARAAQSALARELISVQENERRTLARELHDEMGQTLTALNVTAAHLERNAHHLAPDDVAECANDLRRDIRTSGEQLRAMLKSLRPHGLDAAGLTQMLREVIDGWRGRATGIEFAEELPGAFPALDDEAALTLYRVVQEALTNVVRHSGATQCHLRIAVASDQVCLEINDNGQGLPEAGPARRGGLLGMAERLNMVGGMLDLLTNSRGGLRLVARMPIHNVRAQVQTEFQGALS
jgi:two-component system, NarL family, sensor histidine kinase UhpB